MTTKLMYAVWGDAASALRDPALHAGLTDAGARRLQLNLDDEDVSPAMRIPTGEPIRAVVSVWTDGDAGAVGEALRDVGSRRAGWRVDERRRLDPPEAPDGERADALANVAVLRRPAELSQEEWLRRWLVDHTPIAIRTQATFGYVQNIVLEALTPDAPRVDALVEELFPSAGMTDMHAFYGSGGDRAELDRRLGALMASVGRIGADRDLDLVPTSRYTYRLAPPSGESV
ncbi:EthD domain-containing protein [Nocardioides dongkuii]|uniref:EthD domain-containing protein n=1 Tax=Nocardioides dongkuii TaxID=2760089 RepID=UPI0029D41786|nr:EthD domain-containing protein [Nocardioides dongkuii]